MIAADSSLLSMAGLILSGTTLNNVILLILCHSHIYGIFSPSEHILSFKIFRMPFFLQVSPFHAAVSLATGVDLTLHISAGIKLEDNPIAKHILRLKKRACKYQKAMPGFQCTTAQCSVDMPSTKKRHGRH